MARRKIRNLRVLLTGASSGIGYEMALQLVRMGAHVLATARRFEKLSLLTQETVGFSGSLAIVPGDITEPSHRSSLIAWCEQHWGGLDVLINNAGAGAIGPFSEASSDRLRQVMEVDFFAPAELTRLCLPLLRQGNKPAILNIGSVLGHRAVPNKSEYCAAKFAMRGWSESIRVELAPERIEVLMVSPSTTRSEFFDSLLDSRSDVQSQSLGSMSAERVAKIAIASLVRSKREMIISWGGKALVWFGRFLPSLTDRILAIGKSRSTDSAPRR